MKKGCPMQQITAAQKKIKQNHLASIYVLYGSESFLLKETEQLIIHQAVDEASRAFNVTRFDMAETPVDAAIEEAEALPFMGERRVVIIENPVFLTGNEDKNKVEHHLSKLEKYIDDPSPYTVMIFSAHYEKLDQRKKLVKKLRNAAEMLMFSSLDEATIYDFLREQAQQKGVALTKEAHESLLQFIGPNLFYLTNEVDKMALYVGDDGTIDADVVRLLSAKTLEANVFALMNKVVENRLDEGFSILHDLYKQKEEPIKLLALVARQCRIIFQVKEWLREGYSSSQISKQLKLHPYAVKVAATQAKALQSRHLLKMLQACAETDFAMKTGKMDKYLALELLLARFEQNEKTARS